jgi:acyl-CoA thioester hydrolase
MSRIKIDLPGEFPFSCVIPVRITDINYGGHVGNDTVLSIIHEARMQYFRNFGYTEMNFAGVGMIMANVAIEFKTELFYGDHVIASVAATNFSKIGFELVYRLEKEQDGIRKNVALARTGMICYDYEKKKIVAVPEEGKLTIDNWQLVSK